tara:strand:- start:251 stop:397 length:147 start_codon:yes stop_codon:yes gene_type:complete
MPRYFLVFQGYTYDEEKELSCLLTPKKMESKKIKKSYYVCLEVADTCW